MRQINPSDENNRDFYLLRKVRVKTDCLIKNLTMSSTSRLHNLDYLRGLAAIGIMIYHYTAWGFSEFDSDTLIRRIGIYGVSIFYVLSGLTLFYVYSKNLRLSTGSLLSFFKKRSLRIFPLLWLATITSILLSRISPDITKVALNLTGLFGVVSWDSYFAVGAWSIGNELVFYLFFPAFVFTGRYCRKIFISVIATIFIIYLVFTFNILEPEKPLADQWRNYVNPLNQVFLFLGGFVIGYIFEKREYKNSTSLMILLLAVAAFIFYPANGDAINLVTGVNRLVFTAACFLICLSFYKLTFVLPKMVSKPLEIAGQSSYSIYLLHPFVWSITGGIFSLLSISEWQYAAFIKISLCITGTLLVSYFTYEYFEKYFMRIGRTNQKSSANAE